MKTFVVALMLCLAVPAFAQDGGTAPPTTVTAQCEGFTVTPAEAQAFNRVYGFLIFVASNIVPMDKIANEAEQGKIVTDVLKKLDDAAEGKTEVCIVAPVDSIKLTMIIGDKMTHIIDASGNGPKAGELLNRLAGGPQKAEATVKVFQSVVRKMMAVVNAGSSI